MASDLNQCNFIGRLGADVDMRVTGDGTHVANFRIACGWKNKDKEGAEWVGVVAWGALAEICGKYLKKGSRVFVSGRMQTRKWQAQDGQDRYTTEIVCGTMQMLDGKPGAANEGSHAPAPDATNNNDFEDSIPF